MTRKELNRDIKRLWKSYNDSKELTNDGYFFEIENSIKPEFSRLYYADDNFEYMNIQSAKIMIRLHLTLRVVPLHLFGINIKP